MCVGGITRETYNMRGFRIRTCSQGGLAPWPSPWAAPPSMPVENPAAVNSSVRPRSRKRACYGLSRLRTGEAAEAPHRSVRVVTIVGCGRRVARRRSRVLVPARNPNPPGGVPEPPSRGLGTYPLWRHPMGAKRESAPGSRLVFNTVSPHSRGPEDDKDGQETWFTARIASLIG